MWRYVLRYLLNWQEELIKEFPSWGTQEGIERFNLSKHSLVEGDVVIGKVICRAPFGVWVDINVGYPSLLLLTYFSQADVKLKGFVSYPEVGNSIQATIRVLGANGEIGLTQK